MNILTIFENGTLYIPCYPHCAVLGKMHNHPTDPYLHSFKESKTKEKYFGAVVGLNPK